MSQSFTLTAFIWALVSWFLMVQLGTSSPEEDARNYKKKLPNPPNIGAYRCREDTTVTKAVNTSHLSTKKVLKYEFCWKLPHLRCPKYKDEHVTIYRLKNITRKVATYDCCPGYKGPFDESLPCEPVCEQKCAHGTCVKPDTCSCDPGFSGVQCEEVGCDNGNWGPDCSQPCPCENDGTCEPNTGVCQCNSGYKGVHCQKECPEGRYGLGCEKKCDCGIGTTCHHVTGDCISCTQGFWGEGCASECSCDQNGTALCFHTNGNCFCKSNFYGRRCELFCPFGYLDGVCQSESFNNGSCACPSDLFRCDKDLGCVCKDGLDCEGSGAEVIDFDALSDKNLKNAGSSSAHNQAVVIVVSVLIIAILITILIVIYYRRRMKRLETDLQNRSVMYIENSVLRPPSERLTREHDLVITDPDNKNNYNATSSLTSTQPSPRTMRPNNVSSTTVVLPPANLEKNVNIDRYKLGVDSYSGATSCQVAMEQHSSDEEYQEPYGAAASSASGGRRRNRRRGRDRAEGVIDENYESPDATDLSEDEENEETNINLYKSNTLDESPSKIKNNVKLADFYKKTDWSNKANVANLASALQKGGEASGGNSFVNQAESVSSNMNLNQDESVLNHRYEEIDSDPDEPDPKVFLSFPNGEPKDEEK